LTSLGDRLSNVAALVVMATLFTIPILAPPWPAFLLNSPLIYFKITAGILLAHIGLMLWPCAFAFGRALVHQTRWPERLKFICLIALTLTFAVRSSIRLWELWATAFHYW
jgi:hypothetical protein